ncbi:MAG: DUF5916 domain-containing protein [Bacteroidales bacterium]
MKKILLLALLSFYSLVIFAQAAKKRITAIATTETIKIDGILDEPAWESAPTAKDFVQRQPYNGKPETLRTEVRFLYDNTGLYVGATMFDPHPDSILAQMGLRDAGSLNADNFILIVSPFNDGINAFCFLVWASDVQADFKLTGTDASDDFSWDAVWVSKARKNDRGWIVEMKIPYSAIRFPLESVQEWGVNLQREIRRFRELDTWNLIDSKVSGYVNQSGLLDGIKNIKPPLRLSVSPYLSAYLQNSPGQKTYELSYNYGADLKYGINQSFTLDMTLIPDFGQVRADDKYYNFSPFEIRYDERRQFFTEGTEMFNKGGIFYSRRVGAQPKGYEKPYQQLSDNEAVTDNPSQTKLINASKISGRTRGGLGIGIFNAMSANTWATVTDSVTGESRRIMTQGFTNYNMVVLDQNLKNNSYLDFLNTNYFMPTEGYTANVTGSSFKFANKSFSYALTGDAFVSQKYYSHYSPEFGYHYALTYGKISGNFKFSYQQLLETDKYDPNDMGFNPMNNRFDHTATFEYNLYDPFWKLLSMYNNVKAFYNFLYDGMKFSALKFSAESEATTRKYMTLGVYSEVQPIPGYDFYEPRVYGWMFKTPAYGKSSAWFSSDYRKKFALDGAMLGLVANEYKTSGYTFTLEPRFRVSDRIMLLYHLYYEKILNDVGYVDQSEDSLGNLTIYFGRRDRLSITNILEANYMITSTMSIDLRARHYWVSAPYYSFYTLQQDGSLNPTAYAGDPDVNYNLFNFDLTYIWNFAPGSQLSLMWKNAITTFDNNIIPDFFDDFRNTMNAPGSNSFSIRILYYLDALYFKKKNITKNNYL